MLARSHYYISQHTVGSLTLSLKHVQRLRDVHFTMFAPNLEWKVARKNTMVFQIVILDGREWLPMSGPCVTTTTCNSYTYHSTPHFRNIWKHCPSPHTTTTKPLLTSILILSHTPTHPPHHKYPPSSNPWEIQGYLLRSHEFLAKKSQS